MKMRSILSAMLGAMLILTGCGTATNNMTVQQETVPVVPAETALSERTETTVAEETETVVTEQVVTVSEVQTSAPSGENGKTGSTSQTPSMNAIWGKWETVSFSKKTGESTAYDLSDPVHRSYYVALELNQYGQSALTVGTKSYPAAASLSGSRMTVSSVHREEQITMEFQLSEDCTRMTVELLNGRIIATLKQVGAEFSIQAYLNAAPDISGIIGKWYEADALDSRTLTVNADGTFSLAYRGGGVLNGTVQPEHDKYIFYETNGIVWSSFPKTAAPQNDLYSETDKNLHFIRIKKAEPRISDLAGEWYYDRQDAIEQDVYHHEGFVSVADDGTYTFQPADGSIPKHGKITVEHEKIEGNNEIPLFAFYENDSNELWLGIYCDHYANGIYTVGQEDINRFAPRDPESNIYEEYVGTWEGSAGDGVRCSIRIGLFNEGYQVVCQWVNGWADSALEYDEWEYYCEGLSDNTHLQCTGNGVRAHVVKNEDGTYDRNDIYHDGTALFQKKNGLLRWSDGKDMIAMEVYFKKVE